MSAAAVLRTVLCCALGLGLAAVVFSPVRTRAQGPSRAPLPSAKEIVARYDKALGGEAAIRRHTSSTPIIETHGATLSFTYYTRAPYQRLENTSLPNNKGELKTGFDGELAWALDPRSGPQIDTGDDRESDKRDADFYYPLDELSWFKSMETVGIEDFEGRRCYRLNGINNWGKVNNHLYDVETGLLTAYEFESNAGGAPALTHLIFSDYRPVDGVLFPMKQTVKIKPKGSGDWRVFLTQTYSSVTFNDVDPAVFAPPQVVLDFVAKQKSKSGS